MEKEIRESLYQWQGEPVKVRFGLCTVKPNYEKPLYWYNYDCHISFPIRPIAIIPAIEVTCSWGEPFIIANHYGIGVHKLLNGGWPSHAHSSLERDTFEESKYEHYQIKEFDHEGYSEYKSASEKWFHDKYPEEWTKLMSLRSVIKPPKQ